MVFSSVVQCNAIWYQEVLEEECLSGHLQVLLVRLPHPLELRHLRCYLELLPLRASLEPHNHNPLKLLPLRAEASLEPLHNPVQLLARRVSVVLVLLPNAPGGEGKKRDFLPNLQRLHLMVTQTLRVVTIAMFRCALEIAASKANPPS